MLSLFYILKQRKELYPYLSNTKIVFVLTKIGDTFVKQFSSVGCVPDGDTKEGKLFRICRGEEMESVGEERERVSGLNAVRQTTLLMKV